MKQYEVRAWKAEKDTLVPIASCKSRDDAIVVAEALCRWLATTVEVWRDDRVHEDFRTDRMDSSGWEMWDDPTQKVYVL